MKKIVLASVLLTMVAGGAATAAFAQNDSKDPTDPANLGEYWKENQAIRTTWAALPQKSKDWYISHPSPNLLFPFGIDTASKQPKGYPTCVTADFGASYKPTAVLPHLCKAWKD